MPGDGCLSCHFRHFRHFISYLIWLQYYGVGRLHTKGSLYKDKSFQAVVVIDINIQSSSEHGGTKIIIFYMYNTKNAQNE